MSSHELIKDKIKNILQEFGKGCSDSGKNPSNCGVCTDVAVHAIYQEFLRVCK
jgi:hypothetical protein